MFLSLGEFHCIGREQRHVPELTFPVRAFTWAFGPIGLHSRIRAGHVIRTIKELNLPRDAWVLDAGCGHGLVLFWLAARGPEYQLHGIELESDIIARNRVVAHEMGLTSSTTFEQGDLLSVDIAKATYNLVSSIDVLEHIVDDASVLRKLRCALKPSGILVLHLPLRHQEQRRIFPAFKKHTIEDHVRDEYLPEEIEAKPKATGFAMKSLRYGLGWKGELAFELNNLFWKLPMMCSVDVPVCLVSGISRHQRDSSGGQVADNPGQPQSESTGAIICLVLDCGL